MPSRHLFTADPHFGHPGILKTCARPFASVEAMDAALIASYQATVTAQDDLWIVGDFALDPDVAVRAFAAIPGRKHLIVGNHDLKPWTRRLNWASVHDLHEVKEHGQTFVLCHYPMLTWRGIRRGAVHLFGHIHTNCPGWQGSVNVGVDVCGFRPIDRLEAMERAAALPKNPLWDLIESGL